MSDDTKSFIVTSMIIIIVMGFCFVSGVFLGVSDVIESDRNNEIREMRRECEKDLARNLKCEMVYVKPKDM